MAQAMSRAVVAFSRRFKRECKALDAKTRRPGMKDNPGPAPTSAQIVAKAGGVFAPRQPLPMRKG